MTLPLPLSDLRYDYLSELAKEPGPVSWASRYVITWALNQGYVASLTERELDGHKITPAGEQILALHNWHRFDTGRFTRGLTSIAPQVQLYGTRGSCTCGWGIRINEAPSKGGKTRVTQAYREHMGVIASTMDLT